MCGVRYHALPGWERLPEAWDLYEVAGVAVDSRDRIHVLTRGEHPVIVLDRGGGFLHSWGDGVFPWPHGISIDADDTVYIADSTDHTVRVFDIEGTLLRTLGTPGTATDSGVVPWTVPVQRATGPFNGVTNAARGPGGELYVADGYGNARVHVFGPDGELRTSWGEPGTGNGQLRLPHGIAVDSAGAIYVADRENSRIQVFEPDGGYRRQIHGVHRPDDLAFDRDDVLYVAELGFAAGVIPNGLGATPPDGDPPRGRVSVLTTTGDVLARVEPHREWSPDGFLAPHGIAVDSVGSIYVGEVFRSALRGYAPDSPEVLTGRYRALHKFERV
jgi:DNA-binding beta-propeller fold protein YncE